MHTKAGEGGGGGEKRAGTGRIMKGRGVRVTAQQTDLQLATCNLQLIIVIRGQ